MRVKEFGDNLKIPTYVYEYLKDGFKKAFEISLEEDIILLSQLQLLGISIKNVKIEAMNLKN